MINYGLLLIGVVLLIVGGFALNDGARGYMRTRRGGPRIRFEDAVRNPARAKALYVSLSCVAIIAGISLIISGIA